MSQQQFKKNTNTPTSDSELWSVADGWKISAKSGKIYTNLNNVYKNEVNADSDDNQFYNAMVGQLEGSVKEPIDFIGYYFVAGASQDGTELVYAFDKSNLSGAEKQIKYSFNPTRKGDSVPKGGQQQPKQELLVGKPTSGVLKSTPAPLSTEQKAQTYQETIKTVTDVTPIKAGDIAAIGEAEQRGLYVLPILHVGNQRFCFEDKNGDYILLYGRIINVKVSDN